MSTTRRLAAILAADVAGYSRLMAADEVGTLEALKASRREVVDPAIAAHRGRIVKTTGDGMLVEFASAVDAVTCAMAVQDAMAGRGGEITFRIGINIGDIIIEGDDIFGDGVNIAARVENECAPGGVYLSDDAFRQVRSKTSFAFDDLGERSLKNIDRPIRVYAVRSRNAAAALVALPDAGERLPLPDKPSIAVLPFQNMSGDPEQEYFADGMVEDIITALSRFKSLFVIARNSSFTYKGRAVDVRQVGRELGVRYVLEGSVRKAASRVRITGQLVEAGTGAHLWADQFDGDLTDVFGLQDSITQAVVGTIVPAIQSAEMEQARRTRPKNFDAYDLYLRGLWLHVEMASPDNLTRARQLYDQAIKADPTFAPPLVEAALSYIAEVAQGWVLPTEGLQNAMKYAERALHLDPNDSAVLATVAFVGSLTRGAGNEWISMATRAVALNPNSAFAYSRSGWVHAFSAEPETAIVHFERALRLSPKDMANWDVWTGLGAALLQANRDSDAITAAYNATQNGPNFFLAWRLLVAATALAGRVNEMPQAVARLAELEPNFRIGSFRNESAAFARMFEGLRLAGLPE